VICTVFRVKRADASWTLATTESEEVLSRHLETALCQPHMEVSWPSFLQDGPSFI